MMNHEQGHGTVGQHPEPAESPLDPPGSFINMVDRGLAGTGADFFVVGVNGLCR